MSRGTAGIDPLGEHFTYEAFASLVARHPERSALAFLRDPETITRVTADLAATILDAAQLRPEAAVGRLTGAELHRFHREIRDVLGRLLEGYHGYDA